MGPLLLTLKLPRATNSQLLGKPERKNCKKRKAEYSCDHQKCLRGICHSAFLSIADPGFVRSTVLSKR
jgi:hypothetical protein